MEYSFETLCHVFGDNNGNYRVRGVSLIKFTYFDSCLVFFDFDILSLIKEKKNFCFF